MIEYNTYKNRRGFVTVENQRQRTEHTEYKDVIYSNISRVVTYDEYSPTRLNYLLKVLVGRKK